MAHLIPPNDIEQFSAEYNSDAKSQALANIIATTGIHKASTNPKSLKVDHLYTNKVDDWTVMDQKQSGRCWIYAGMNLYKPGLLKKYNLKDIELSSNYIQFWDFLEKSNLFLENVEKTAQLDIDDHLVTCIMGTGLEGGWWDMFINIVNKYGIVPETAMPNTFDADQAGFLTKNLMSYLRSQAKTLRELCDSNREESQKTSLKKNTLNHVYRVLSIALGQPPQHFDWTYQDKDKKVQSLKKTSPLEFSKLLDEQNCVTLINDPRKERPFMKRYSCEYIGNTTDGEKLNFINVDIDVMKSMVKKMIDAGRLIWMSCDVGKMANHEKGTFYADNFLFNEILDLPESLDKAERLNYQDSGGNHAMLFTGYHEVDGKVTKWRIENSWGEKKGKKGYYEMDDQWFDEYVYTSLICKDMLPDDVKAVLDQEAVMLMPWEFPY